MSYLVDISPGHLEVLSSEYELFQVYSAVETQINRVTSVSPRVGVGEKSGWPFAAASPPRSQSCVLLGKLTIRLLVSLIEMNAVSLLNRGGIADKAESVSLHGRMSATKETRRDVRLATIKTRVAPTTPRFSCRLDAIVDISVGMTCARCLGSPGRSTLRVRKWLSKQR